jgi:hypothetical protein
MSEAISHYDGKAKLDREIATSGTRRLKRLFD